MSHSSSVRLSVVAGGMLLALSRGAEAQEARPPAAIETWAGYAKGWGEDQDGNHAQVGAGIRFYVSPRVSLSPRVRYASRFGTPDDVDDHTELALETASEFLRPVSERPRMVSLFLLVSGGVSIRRYPESRFLRERTFTDAGLMSMMVGVRVFLPFASRQMYVAPEAGYGALTLVPAAITFGMPLE